MQKRTTWKLQKQTSIEYHRSHSELKKYAEQLTTEKSQGKKRYDKKIPTYFID